MKKAVAVSIVALAFSSAAFAQNSESMPVNDKQAVELEDFEGCSIAPPRDGCSARISCNGEGQIMFKDASGVREATKEASLNARKKLSQFFNDKIKAKEALVKATKTVAKRGADGQTATQEMTKTTAEITQSSTESLLQGVLTLGRTVDMEGGVVVIKIGQSCKSKAIAAQGAQVVSAQGGAAGNAGAAGGGAKVYEGQVRSVRQRSQNADNF